MKMRRGEGGGRGNGIPAPPTPVPPLVFLAFFTYHYLPLPERLEQARYLGIGFHGTRKNQNPQGLFQVGETCRIKQPFFST